MFLHGLVVLLFLLDVSSLQARGASADQIDQQILEIERYLDAGDPDERDASRDAQAWKNLGKSPLEAPPSYPLLGYRCLHKMRFDNCEVTSH